MKIAFVVGDFPSLSETFVLNQITGLIDRGHQVSIFAERQPATGTMHADVERYGLLQLTRWELLPPPLRRFASLGKVMKWDRDHLRAVNPLQGGWQSAPLRLSLRMLWASHLFDGARDFDIIQCHFGAHGAKAAHLRSMGALRGKLVTTFHGDDIICYPRQFRGNVYAPLFQQGDLFLPVSEFGRGALIAQGCPAERIRVHRMGVDLRRFQSIPRQGSHAGIRIVTVGRLVEKKGIEDAIRAVAGLGHKCDCEFVVAGDGPLRSPLEKLAVDLGVAVRFAGALRQDEIVALMTGADIFLAPSVTGSDGDIEGIPVSIMEAMAAGLPVISTWHGGIAELVSDGASGLLAAEHDVANLTRHLKTLAESPELRERMGAAGRETILREFDISKLNQQLAGLYEQLLADKETLDERPPRAERTPTGAAEKTTAHLTRRVSR